MGVISTRKVGDVLVVSSNNPPVNALSHPVRVGLLEAIQGAASDNTIKAIVIACEGRTFFAGADITEFGKGAGSGPSLPELVDALEASPIPLVAAIHGTALGGGLEVALGCHYRIAIPSAKLGLPEVKLGILPGAGGTQRLPRVIGVEAALPIIVTGDPISAQKAETLGLVDKLAGENSLEADAVAFAREMSGRSNHPVASSAPTKSADAARDPEVFERFRRDHARRIKGLDAPEACIEAVKAAVELPFAEGIKRERELFFKLVTGDQSRALRHVFFSERAAAKIDGLASDTPLIPVKRVGILGAGTMGGGIAMNFLSAGFAVTLVEREAGALERGVSVVRKNYENTAKKGRITTEQVDKAMGLLTPTLEVR